MCGRIPECERSQPGGGDITGACTCLEPDLSVAESREPVLECGRVQLGGGDTPLLTFVVPDLSAGESSQEGEMHPMSCLEDNQQSGAEPSKSLLKPVLYLI